MSFLKAAFAVAAIAGTAYVGYRAAKKHPKTTRTIAKVILAAGSATANAGSKTIHVRETETVIKADKENMGGVMGVAAQSKARGTTVRVQTTANGTRVTVDRPVVEMLEPIAFEDAEKHFGGL